MIERTILYINLLSVSECVKVNILHSCVVFLNEFQNNTSLFGLFFFFIFLLFLFLFSFSLPPSLCFPTTC